MKPDNAMTSGQEGIYSDLIRAEDFIRVRDERDRLRADVARLREALKYARRFLDGAKHDIAFVDAALVAGVISRGDGVEGGVYKPAAGIERGIMRSCLGFETEEVNDERKRDVVFPKRINPLHTATGEPRYVKHVGSQRGRA